MPLIAVALLSVQQTTAQPVDDVVEAPTVSSGSSRSGSSGYGSASGYGSGSYYSSSSRSASNYEDIPELTAIYEAGKNYDSLVAKIKRLLIKEGATNVRNNEDYSSYNRAERRYNFSAVASKTAYYKLKDALNALPNKFQEIRESSQRIYFGDTARMQEELRFYKREKNKLSSLLDTMTVTNPQYRGTSQQVLSLISQIANKQNEFREAISKMEMPYKLNIQIFTNYNDYYNRNNTGTSSPGYGSINKKPKANSWTQHFIPGISYVGMNPTNTDTMGRYAGISPEISLYSKFKNYGYESQPGYVNFYARLGILNSDKSNVAKIYYTGLGVRFSFENKLKRQYLIPFFSDEFSYVHREGTGGALLNIPGAGMYLYTGKHLQAYFSGGYVYPFSKRESYESFTFSGGISYTLWR